MVRDAVELLAERGPALGRPLADRITGSRLHNLKELRPLRLVADFGHATTTFIDYTEARTA